MNDEMLKINEYATAMHLAKGTIHKMLRAKRLPGAVIVGNSWRIPQGTIPLTVGEAVKPPSRRSRQATTKVLSTPPTNVPDNKLSLKALALIVNGGDATEEQEAQFARRIKTLQSVNAVAILKGVVMTEAEIKAKIESIAAIDEKIAILESKESFVEDREKYLATLEEALDGQQADFRKEKRKWESIIEDFKDDLAKLKDFYTSIIAIHPDVEKDLIPKLKLSEKFYSSNTVEEETKNGWSDKEKAELEVGEDED